MDAQGLRRILVTGGSGFIGSNLVRYLREEIGVEVGNVDKLTYAAAPGTLRDRENDAGYRHARLDIGDQLAIRGLLEEFRPDAVMNLAAESHVDRSIDQPAAFVQTNVAGTCGLLTAVRDYWESLDPAAREAFRFHHISTDEVYGALGPTGVFTENSAYAPRSPYAASKAASDHLVRAWAATYGLPVVISNVGNNYGPYQFPEKLIPLMIINCLSRADLPVYGDGLQMRDWVHVSDHVRALWMVLSKGAVGETYNIGARCEQTNLEVVHAICDGVDELTSSASGASRDLIRFVEDRPGHDRRYAIDPSKIESKLGWKPHVDFRQGLSATIRWYQANRWWWEPLRDTRDAVTRRGLRFPNPGTNE